jgi:hypothetical protein
MSVWCGHSLLFTDALQHAPYLFRRFSLVRHAHRAHDMHGSVRTRRSHTAKLLT